MTRRLRIELVVYAVVSLLIASLAIHHHEKNVAEQDRQASAKAALQSKPAAGVNSYLGGECEPQFSGTHGVLPAKDVSFLADFLSSYENKKRGEVLRNSLKRLLIVRRYVSGGVDSRGGNLWVEVTPGQIDKFLMVHIPAMKLPRYLASGKEKLIQQDAQDAGFSGSDPYFPVADGSAIFLDRAVCGKDKKCDLLPFGPKLEDLMSNLLHCSGSTKAAYVFKDGMIISGMDLIPWPIGEAFFFTRTPAGYKLAAMIDFE